MRTSRNGPGRIALDPVEERWTGEDSGQRRPDAGVEITAILPRLPVERHRSIDVGRRYWPTECAARERIDDPRRARLFIPARYRPRRRAFGHGLSSRGARRGAGPTDEDARAARRGADP